MNAVTLPLQFQIGARTLFALPRRLVRLGLSLDDALGAALWRVRRADAVGRNVDALEDGDVALEGGQ